MAIDTSTLETLYLAKIAEKYGVTPSIEGEQAKILLANYLAALTAESGMAGDNIQSWTMAGKTFTTRELNGLRPANRYLEELNTLLGIGQKGAFVSCGGVYL